MTAWLFSGQLSEHAGMGADFFAASAEARELLARTSDRCGFDLGGALADPARVGDNRVAQPGVFLVSVLAARELFRRGRVPAAIAGYSLGNYAALVAAGAVSDDDALTVLLAVFDTVERLDIRGGMGAVIGIPAAAVEEVCAGLRGRGAPVWIGNVNAATQLVLTGSEAGIEGALAELAPRALKVIRLPMTWPIHSALMEPVARAVRPIVEGCASIAAPRFPLYAGHRAERIDSAAAVADLLARQIALPSRWKETVETMFADGHRDFLEVGPGETLSRMLRWIVREGRCRPAGTLAAIESVTAAA
ncbi:MAG TPA: ACP S-malonyltransferase [Thermoanaerobaculia bacterium]|nr:ACP S-malonyltransferase [Thermoanaerobaculia bacterium]